MDITDEMRAEADKVAEERMAAWRMQSNRIAYVDSMARQVAYETARRLAPLIAAQALRPAAEAKRRLYARLIANAPLLDVPFTDAPDQSPWTRLKADMHRLNRALGVRTDCPTCSGPTRETVGMVCQTCGTDYARDTP